MTHAVQGELSVLGLVNLFCASDCNWDKLFLESGEAVSHVPYFNFVYNYQKFIFNQISLQFSQRKVEIIPMMSKNKQLKYFHFCETYRHSYFWIHFYSTRLWKMVETHEPWIGGSNPGGNVFFQYKYPVEWILYLQKIVHVSL